MQKNSLNTEFPNRHHLRTVVETDRRFRSLEARYLQILAQCDALEQEIARVEEEWQNFPN